MVTCRECNQECGSSSGLSYHLRSHGIGYVDYVVKHEHDGKWPVCSCGKKLSHKRGGFPRFCSKSCASSGVNNPMHGKTGDKSPIYGMRRTADQLKNYSEGAKKRWQIHGDMLREMMNTDEYKDAMSVAGKESYATTDRAKKTSESVNQFWATSPKAASLRKEASDRAVKLLEQGLIGPHAPFKTEWKLNPFTGAEEFMHSSWESAFLDACVARGHRVTKAHGITISYTHPDGSARTYVPDFFASDAGILYEVKGRHDGVDDAKWEAARSFCESRGWRFEVLFEETYTYSS